GGPPNPNGLCSSLRRIQDVFVPTLRSQSCDSFARVMLELLLYSRRSGALSAGGALPARLRRRPQAIALRTDARDSGLAGKNSRSHGTSGGGAGVVSRIRC